MKIHILKRLWLVGVVGLLGLFWSYSGIHSQETKLGNKFQEAEQTKSRPQYVPDEVIIELNEDSRITLNQRYSTVKARHQDIFSRLKTEYNLRDERAVFEGVHKSLEPSDRTQKELIEEIKTKFSKRQTRTFQETKQLNFLSTYVLKIEADENVFAICAKLKQDPDVKSAYPNYRIKYQWIPNDPYYHSSGSWGQSYDDLWGLKPDKLNCEDAWDIDISQGEGIVIAVVDTGIDYNHEDIADNIWVNLGEVSGNGVDDDNNGYVDDVRGWDFAYGDNDPLDGNGHGTHVSGTIAAVGNNGLGVIGVAPQAQIMTIKGLDDEGYGNIADLSDGIVYAAANGADVINNSWGPTYPAPTTPGALRLAVEFASEVGAVVVAAAGNSNDQVEAGYYPAALPKVISVGSVDHLGEKSDFSNFGQKLDVMAPGGESGPPCSDFMDQSILSLRASGTDMYAACGPDWEGQMIVDNNYYRSRGTSMAAPHVSGLVALLLSAEPTITIAQLRKQLYGNTIDQGTPGFDPQYGFGFIQADAALEDSQDYILARITQPFTGFLFGQELSIIGIAAAKNFSHYEVLIGEGEDPTNWETTGITLTGGEVVEDVLATWDTRSLPDGLWSIRLIVYDTIGDTREHEVTVTVNNLLQPGWPQSTFLGSGSYHTTLVVADLEGDGPKEIIAGSYEGLLYAWHHDGTLVSGFPVYVGGYNGEALTPAVGDVDLDGNLEIAVGANTTHPYGEYEDLHLLQYDGTPMPGWPKISSNYISDPPTLADIDGDEDLEILVGEEDWYVHAYHHTGEPVVGWPVHVDHGQNVSGVSVGDIDGDGDVEVFAGQGSSAGGFLYAWHHGGTRVSGWPVEMVGTIYVAPAIGDVDGNGLNEIVASTYRNIWVIRGDGIIESGWPQLVEDNAEWSSVALGDMDGDGIVDIVASGEDGNIWAWHGNGVSVAGFPVTFDNDFSRGLSATIGDVDGDGLNEIVTGAGSGIVILEHDGAIKTGWPQSVDVDVAPAIADLDQDGDIEVIAYAKYPDTNIYVWDLQEFATDDGLAWPMLGQNARHTGLALPLTPPDYSQAPDPISGLSTTAGDGKVILQWEPSLASDFSHYNIYRRVDFPIDTVIQMLPIDFSITNPNLSYFIDTTVTNETIYYYAVTAVDTDGNENPLVDSEGPVQPKPEGSPLTLDVIASADNEINSGSPDTVHQVNVYPRVGYSDIYQQTYRYFATFDLSYLPLNSMIQQATFRISKSSNSWGNPDTSDGLYQVLDSWDPETLTWNTQPPLSNTPESSVSGNPWGIIEFDASALVAGWVNGSTPNYGIALKNTSEGPGCGYRSYVGLEYSGSSYCRPQLQITYILDYPNQSPFLILPPEVINYAIATESGTPLTLILQAVDPDEDTITLNAQLADGTPIEDFDMSFIDHGNGTGTFCWTPNPDQTGEYMLTFTVSDGLLEDSETITITVLPASTITVDLEVEALSYPVERAVTFVITKCGGALDTRTEAVNFDSTGTATVILEDVDADADWISAQEGHTLIKLAALDFDGDNNAFVDFTADNKLIAGDFHTDTVPQDNLVDITDFSILASNWNLPIDPNLSIGADATGDGVQDTADFTAIQINFFKLGDQVDGCGGGRGGGRAGGEGSGEVDLSFQPASDTVTVGQLFEIGLYASSETEEALAGLDIVLSWDASFLELIAVNDGPYNWLMSGLIPDENLDGLNNELDDGDARYLGLANPFQAPVATAEGLLVATFQFRALAETELTQIVIEPSLGEYSTTRVLGMDYPNQNVTGDLGSFSCIIEGAGSGCFLTGTPILLPDGATKPIEELKVGDVLLAFDEETGQFRPDTVKRVFVFAEEEREYLLINGHLKVTPHHYFATTRHCEETRSVDEAIPAEIASVASLPRNDKAITWVEAGKLAVGDKLLNAEGEAEPISSIEHIKKDVTVYNLEVNPYHTFIAGGVVVHNAELAQPKSKSPVSQPKTYIIKEPIYR